ncbi:MAG: hypothetical protein GX444_04405 [Myxococcales bacterium]|nr:hypothetical protein [Myxococcales bacterium]
MPWKQVFCLSACLILLPFVLSACTEKQQTDDDNDDETDLFADFHEGQSSCLNEAYSAASLRTESEGDDTTVDCQESLNMFWDGQTLFIKHLCVQKDCGFRLEFLYTAVEPSLLMYENDVGYLAPCSCPFDLAYKATPPPGDYNFELRYKDTYNNSRPGYRGQVELPAGEERSYTF